MGAFDATALTMMQARLGEKYVIKGPRGQRPTMDNINTVSMILLADEAGS